ncbi:Phosphoglycerate mutase-like protein [Mycena indigotica]|uniref:Phosphoglycerate mutase-like protein n=1 Tax=Mycena indigotica TaxID=2126181 RepID=A0A8H6SC31_9AGAR|nr:Phosphoglycerate mutase-like protein [Mycena indigotica]KAF7295587.1 Phosphoglycerate mutase-like protein [Mycena indigotica]
MPFARVYIVRHGETQENRDSIIQGQLDTELNKLGEQQAAQAARALKDVKFDAAYSSDLRRAVKTAETIVRVGDQTVDIRKEDALRERFMGTLQGVQWVNSRDHNKKLMADPTIETTESFATRTASWWKRAILQRTLALSSHGKKGETYNILVVSHGGTISMLVKGLLGSGRAVLAEGVDLRSLKNVSVTIVEVDSERDPAVVVKYGDVSHLEAELEVGLVHGNVDEVKN